MAQFDSMRPARSSAFGASDSLQRMICEIACSRRCRNLVMCGLRYFACRFEFLPAGPLSTTVKVFAKRTEEHQLTGHPAYYSPLYFH